MSENWKKIVIVSTLISFLLTSVFSPSAQGTAFLKINLTTSQPSYSLEEDVKINGELTFNGSLVTDGLVSIQVNDPKNNLFAVRTLPTGSNITGHRSLEITEVTSCDSGGNPKTSFQPGGYLGFKVTVKNNNLCLHSGIVIITAIFPDKTPFLTYMHWNGTVDGGKTETIISWPHPIPPYAPTGTVMVYANILTKLPINGGFAYAPEETTTFTIGSGASGAGTTSTTQSSQGTFNMTLGVYDYGGKLGNYTVYACSKYGMYLNTNQTKFEMILDGDVNGDSMVDMKDIAPVAAAFGSNAGDPRYNPDYDLNKDGTIDMKDLARVATNYGKYGTY